MAIEPTRRCPRLTHRTALVQLVSMRPQARSRVGALRAPCARLRPAAASHRPRGALRAARGALRAELGVARPLVVDCGALRALHAACVLAVPRDDSQALRAGTWQRDEASLLLSAISDSPLDHTVYHSARLVSGLVSNLVSDLESLGRLDCIILTLSPRTLWRSHSHSGRPSRVSCVLFERCSLSDSKVRSCTYHNAENMASLIFDLISP